MHLNNDLQASVIGVTQNNHNRLINLKMLACNEILPPQLVELNAAVSLDRKSTRLNSSHSGESRMPSSA